MNNQLEKALNKLNLAERRQFARLEPEEQERLEADYARHYFASKKCDIGPDPRFIPEWIHDLRTEAFMTAGATA